MIYPLWVSNQGVGESYGTWLPCLLVDLEFVRGIAVGDGYRSWMLDNRNRKWERKIRTEICIEDEPQSLRESDYVHVLNDLGHVKLSEDIENDEAALNSDFGMKDVEYTTHGESNQKHGRS